jgi:hypothetical protein
VKRRGVDDRQQLGPRRLGLARGLGVPGVLADQQAHAHAAGVEHAGALPRHEVAPLVEHLVVGQALLGVGGRHLAVADHAGGVVALADGHAGAARVAAHRVADHDHQVLQGRRLARHGLHGLVAGRHEGRAQQQVLGDVAADRSLGRQQQARALGVRCAPRR